MSVEEKFVEWISFWNHSRSPILSRTFCKQNDVISQSYKLVDNSKMKQRIKKFLKDIRYHLTVLFICINKNFHFRSPLRGVSNETSLIFIILIEISSHPCALLGLRDLMIFKIFSSEMLKSLIKEVGTGIC